MLYPVGKQAYKLKLFKKWRIHDVFHISLLEQDTIKKKRINKNATKLDAGNDNSENHKMKAI